MDGVGVIILGIVVVAVVGLVIRKPGSSDKRKLSRTDLRAAGEKFAQQNPDDPLVLLGTLGFDAFQGGKAGASEKSLTDWLGGEVNAKVPEPFREIVFKSVVICFFFGKNVREGKTTEEEGKKLMLELLVVTRDTVTGGPYTDDQVMRARLRELDHLL